MGFNNTNFPLKELPTSAGQIQVTVKSNTK